MDLSVSYILSIFGKTLGLILLFIAYMYIDKLEKIGCVCAEHPHRKPIKNFLIFAMLYFALTVFFPPAITVKYLGPVTGSIYVALDTIFVLVSLVFFILILKYVRYLTVEKCKCSEDVRREVVYIYAIVEVIILVLLVVLPIVLSIIKGAFALAVTSVKEIQHSVDDVSEAVFNPLKAIKKGPKAIVRNVRETLSLPKTAYKGIKRIATK
jgi:hypothetical protein